MGTDNTLNYFTKDNITFLLALIGSVGTITTWLLSYIKSRRNITIRLIAFDAKDNKILCYLFLENKSSLPISLTALSVIIDGVSFPCRYLPQKVRSDMRTVGSNVVSSQDYFNMTFPVQIGPLGATSGYVLFVIPPSVLIPDSKTVTFQVSSNRGRTFETKLSLDQIQETL